MSTSCKSCHNCDSGSGLSLLDHPHSRGNLEAEDLLGSLVAGLLDSLVVGLQGSPAAGHTEDLVGNLAAGRLDTPEEEARRGAQRAARPHRDARTAVVHLDARDSLVDQHDHWT